MSSSTSSFRSELKVVAAVALALLAVEMTMRRVETGLSYDIAHTRSGPQIADKLQSEDRTDILFLGNSLTRYGIDASVVAGELDSADNTLTNVQLYHPDATAVTEWAYAFRRFFARPGKLPDVLVIGTARTHLNDAYRFPERVGAYFCDLRDLPRVLRHEVRSIEDGAKFVLTLVSAAYTGRHRIQPRLFTAIIPYYQEILPLLTTVRTDPGQTLEGFEVTHRNLNDLLSLANGHGVRTAVLAIPMPEDYELPPDVLKILEDSRTPLIDARHLSGISEESFPDGYHLGEEGAHRVSRHVARKLKPLLTERQP